jgi:hypothetical protein
MKNAELYEGEDVEVGVGIHVDETMVRRDGD